MSFVDGVLSPIAQLIAYLIFGVGFLVVVLFILKKIHAKTRFWFRYKFLRRAYKEDDVAWCIGANERGMKEFEVRRYLLLKNQPTKRVDEMVYIFKKVKKKMKGGIENGG